MNSNEHEGGESTLAALLHRKVELEHALQWNSDDKDLRDTYFSHAANLATHYTGISQIRLPELGYPLHFRCGTPDIGNLISIFRDNSMDFPYQGSPEHIIIIGSYVGYSAIRIANRYPQAQILCVEPLPANLRLLRMNTLPCPRITVIGSAAWHSPAHLGVGMRLSGDWAVALTDRAKPRDLFIPANSVDALLAAAHWSHADLAICDASGAEAAVFADPQAPWISQLDAALVYFYPNIAPGSDKLVSDCFPGEYYESHPLTQAHFYYRRKPLHSARQTPEPLPLLSSDCGLESISLDGIEAFPWAFFIFDEDCFQLHPGSPGSPPARAIFSRSLDGQSTFNVTLNHAGQTGDSVEFAVTLSQENGPTLVRESRILHPQERVSWTIDFPASSGHHRISLETTMATGATTNNNAWARWLHPILA